MSGVQTASEIVEKLSKLTEAHKSAPEYFEEFLDSPDDVLSVGAWCILIDRREVRFEHLSKIAGVSRFAAIRTRAFRLLADSWRYDLARAVAMTDLVASEDAAETLMMAARLRADSAGVVEANRLQFLTTGDTGTLQSLVQSAEADAGWESALPYAVDRVLLAPHNGVAAAELLALLYGADAADLMAEVLAHFGRADLHEPLRDIFVAAVHQMKGESKAALSALKNANALKVVRPEQSTPSLPILVKVRAEALEALGRYRDAYAAYAEMNAVDTGRSYDLGAFSKAMVAYDSVDTGELPPDPRAASCFDMLGFPRSGTTLLENALSAHPSIETFEEVTSINAARRYLARALPSGASQQKARDAFIVARERYYLELDRLRKKPEATVLVDKMPLRSAEAPFIAKLFPEKRYIFSIRHPYDAVLSAFKQHFGPNFAMEHFRRFDTSVRMYDFTMSQWFSVFSMNDPRVHYVRYDTLVMEFEPTIRGTLDFLGLEWDDDVLDFASAAQKRSAKTPSYLKVRQGLSIGIQSSWRNYDFLFQSDAAKPLYKWAEFFGYPTA